MQSSLSISPYPKCRADRVSTQISPSFSLHALFLRADETVAELVGEGATNFRISPSFDAILRIVSARQRHGKMTPTVQSDGEPPNPNEPISGAGLHLVQVTSQPIARTQV